MIFLENYFQANLFYFFLIIFLLFKLAQRPDQLKLYNHHSLSQVLIR